METKGFMDVESLGMFLSELLKVPLGQILHSETIMMLLEREVLRTKMQRLRSLEK
jgi:hypothetical protein